MTNAQVSSPLLELNVVPVLRIRKTKPVNEQRVITCKRLGFNSRKLHYINITIK